MNGSYKISIDEGQKSVTYAVTVEGNDKEQIKKDIEDLVKFAKDTAQRETKLKQL